jgi:hypothetical protein
VKPAAATKLERGEVPATGGVSNCRLPSIALDGTHRRWIAPAFASMVSLEAAIAPIRGGLHCTPLDMPEVRIPWSLAIAGVKRRLTGEGWVECRFRATTPARFEPVGASRAGRWQGQTWQWLGHLGYANRR